MTNVKFQLPFNGFWLIFWGGDTEKLNAHHGSAAQKYAFDFIIKGEHNKTYKNHGLKNEDYFCFGKDVLVPADGEVVEIVDGVRDNKPGDTNRYVLAGNYALIKHNDETFSFLAHLKLGSPCVKSGQKVIIGQKIGECGNSGNSAQPHLHFHVQNSFVFNRYDKEWKTEEIAQGIKVQFTKIIINKDNKHVNYKNFSPIKDDTVSNIT